MDPPRVAVIAKAEQSAFSFLAKEFFGVIKGDLSSAKRAVDLRLHEGVKAHEAGVEVGLLRQEKAPAI